MDKFGFFCRGIIVALAAAKMSHFFSHKAVSGLNRRFGGWDLKAGKWKKGKKREKTPREKRTESGIVRDHLGGLSIDDKLNFDVKMTILLIFRFIFCFFLPLKRAKEARSPLFWVRERPLRGSCVNWEDHESPSVVAAEMAAWKEGDAAYNWQKMGARKITFFFSALLHRARICRGIKWANGEVVRGKKYRIKDRAIIGSCRNSIHFAKCNTAT